MLHPGLYEQVINNALTGELAEIPEARKSVAPIDKAEASKVLAQYLADVVQKGLDTYRWGKSFLRPKSKKKRGGTPIQPMSGQAAQRMLYSKHLRGFRWISPSLERVCCLLTRSAY